MAQSFFTHSSIPVICIGDLFSTDDRGCHGAPLTRNRLHYISLYPSARTAGTRKSVSQPRVIISRICRFGLQISLSEPAREIAGRAAREFVQSLGEPAYRGGQIYHALYAERRFDVAAMSNLPVALRERLAREAAIACRRSCGDTNRGWHGAICVGASCWRTVAMARSWKARDSRNCLHAGRKSPDDLHFHAGGLRGGLPFLPDRDAGADSQI